MPGPAGPGAGRRLPRPRRRPLLVGDPTDPAGALPSLPCPTTCRRSALEARRSLLEAVEQVPPRGRRADPESLAKRALYRQAYELLSDPDARRAFDLSAEPERVRDRYGRFRSGQSCLLARRLVEAGVPWITVVWNHSARGQDTMPDAADWLGWDTHNDLFDVMGELLPRFDHSLSALLEDLDARGLLDETLVVCMGEFGRAPRIALEKNFSRRVARAASTGRTPIRSSSPEPASTPGAVLGATDRMGAYPTADRVGPWDVAATMFAALGVDPATEYRDPLDRPFPASMGRPIAALYG